MQKSDPDDAAGWRELGMQMLASGTGSEEALEYCKQAVLRQPTEAGGAGVGALAAWCAYGSALHLAGKASDAAAWYRKGLEAVAASAGAPGADSMRYQLANNLANWLRCAANLPSSAMF